MTLDEIVSQFHELFERDYHTRLVAGAEEPLYIPDADSGFHHIYFRGDYIASALHEIAHWCLAGPSRRQVQDYGYWYESARDEFAQAHFEQAEIRPQALEFIFSRAADLPFRLSADNLAMPQHDTAVFGRSVTKAARQMLLQGLPKRALRFASALDPARQYEKFHFCIKDTR